MTQEKEIEKYLSQIESQLRGSRKEKKLFMEALREKIQQETENGDIEAIKKLFGTPERVAQEYLANLSKEEIIQEIQKFRRRKYAFLVSAIAAFLMMMIAVWSLFQNTRNAKTHVDTNLIDDGITSTASVSPISNGEDG